MTMPQPQFIDDAAATQGTFCGNPDTVCLLERPTDIHWMQRVADEVSAFRASPCGGEIHRRLASDRLIPASRAITCMEGRFHG